MGLKKDLNRILVGILISLWFTFHLVTNAFYTSETGYVWLCGFRVHGSIIIDMVFWSGLCILFVFMVMIE
jgi:hypothetical protein